jgi:uncharacterized membrane protein
MKSTPLTQGMALLILALYVLYGLFALPFAGLLLSLAVGLIAFGGMFCSKNDHSSERPYTSKHGS